MQNKEKITIQPDDLLDLQFINGAAVSPDGQKVLYSISSIDRETKSETAALWLLDAASGVSRQFSSGAAFDYSPSWSADGKKVAFVSTRSGAPQIYLQPADGGEALRLTELKLGVGGGPVWSPDGSALAFTAAAAENSTPPNPGQPVRVSRPIYRFNALGYLHLRTQNIYIVDIHSREIQQLTDNGWMNTNPLWAPDGEEILFFKNLAPDSHNIYDFQICTVNRSGVVRTLVPVTILAMAAAWTPDGQQVVFSGTEPGQPVFSNTDLWVVDRDGGQPQNRTARLDFNVTYGLQGDLPERLASQICISGDRKTAYCDVQAGGTVQIYAISLQGEESWQPVVTGNRSTHLQGMGEEGLIYTGRDFFHPSNLYHSGLEGQNERKLTHLNNNILGDRIEPEVLNLHFNSPDGQPVEGWLMKPTTEAVLPYPTILYIHGGPQAAFGSTYSFDFNLLAGAGYAVLFINPRGSTGYSSAFTTAIVGDLGGLDYQDIMAGVDHVVAAGLADPQRLGITGASYGGYLSSLAIGKTTRFKAAVIESPVIDFISTYGTSDLGVFLCTQALGGAPHEIPETYRRCSPITYAHNVQTPTLLIHNENDLRSPAGQPEQFYTALKANGCIVEMLRLPHSHHGGTFRGPVEVRLAQNEALLDWVQKYV